MTAKNIRHYLSVLESYFDLTYGYHVSSSKFDDVISLNGINTKNNRVYFWTNYEMADWFRDLHEADGKKMSIWMVDISGLSLEEDPEAIDMSDWSTRFKPNTSGGAFFYDGKISPERIIRKVS